MDFLFYPEEILPVHVIVTEIFDMMEFDVLELDSFDR